jgi:hypothetical protein
MHGLSHVLNRGALAVRSPLNYQMPSPKSKSGRRFRPLAPVLHHASDYNLPPVLKCRFDRMIKPRVRRSGIPMNAAISQP